MEITTFKKIAMQKYAACSGKRGRKQTVTPMEMPKKASAERPAWFQKMLAGKKTGRGELTKEAGIGELVKKLDLPEAIYGGLAMAGGGLLGSGLGGLAVKNTKLSEKAKKRIRSLGFIAGLLGTDYLGHYAKK